MSQFDMNQFVNFLNGKKAQEKEKKEEREKLRFFKPIVGEVNVRWLPGVLSDNGAPAFCVWYYDNQEVFGERRAVAPFQFGQEDPIKEYIEKKRQERLSKEEFISIVKISPKPSWYIPILIRGKESDGAYLWELNDKRFKEVAMLTIAHPDWQDDLITDPQTGRDIMVQGKLGDKVWQGKRLTEWNVSARGRASKLAPTQQEIDTILASIQDPVEYNKTYLRKPEFYEGILTTALSYFSNGGRHVEESGTSRGGSQPKTSSEERVRDSVDDALDAAFSDENF